MKYTTTLFSVVIFLHLKGSSQVTTSQTLGQVNTLTPAVPFLLITPDARAGGLGDAGCASSPDVHSNYWNVSKTVFAEKRNGISVSYTPWLRSLAPDINLLDVSIYRKINGKNALGFSGRYLSYGDVTFLPAMITNQIRPYEYAYAVSYSRLLTSKLSLGISARKIYSNLTGGNIAIAGVKYFPAGSIAGDLSCYWKDTLRLHQTVSELAWGVNISNIGNKIKYSNSTFPGDFLPANLKIGVSDKFTVDEHNSFEILCDANKLLVPTPPEYAPFTNVITSGMNPNRSVFDAIYTSFYDAPGGFKEELHEIMISAGVEYWYKRSLALRTGYFYEHKTKGGRKYFTLGIGGRYAGLALDLSYLIPTEQRHPLQNTLRFTLHYEFGSEKIRPGKRNPAFIG